MGSSPELPDPATLTPRAVEALASMLGPRVTFAEVLSGARTVGGEELFIVLGEALDEQWAAYMYGLFSRHELGDARSYESIPALGLRLNARGRELAEACSVWHALTRDADECRVRMSARAWGRCALGTLGCVADHGERCPRCDAPVAYDCGCDRG